MSQKDLPSPNATNFQNRVREEIHRLMGKFGANDRALTLRDALDTGLLVPGPGGFVPGFGTGDTGETGGEPVYVPDLTPPPQPDGFAVDAAISHIFIEHAAPTYTQGHGHMRTVVYGAQVSPALPNPVFSDAIEIAQFTGTVFAYPTNPATTWRLWIKWQTNDGVLSATPAGGTNGLQAITAQDPAKLLEALAGQITASELAASLSTPIGQIQSLSSGLAQEVLDRAAADLANANALAQEATDRTNALLAESNARATAIDAADAAVRADLATADAAVVLSLTNSFTAADAVALAEAKAFTYSQATIDGALSGLSTTLTANFNTADAAVLASANNYTYAKATIDSAITAEGNLVRSQFAAADATTLASAQNFTYARATIDSAIATSTNTLRSQITGGSTATDLNALTSGLLFQERTTRASEDAALSQQITLLSAGAGEQFDYSNIWTFDATVEGWTANTTTSTSFTAVGGWLRMVATTGTQSARMFQSPAALAIEGAKYPQVKARIRRVGSPTWVGRLYFTTTADATWNTTKSVVVSAPTFDAGNIGLLTFNMPAGWTSATIAQIRFELSTNITTANYYELDWAAIGRPSPGASSAQLTAEQIARQQGDDAEAAARLALAAVVAGKAEATALNELTTRVTAAEGVNTSQSTSITALGNDVTTLTGTVNTKADATALNALTTRVTNAEGVNTSQGTSITTLTNNLSTLTSTVDTKANASALNDLTTRVTAAEGVNTSQGTSITALNSNVSTLTTNLATKADATALTALTTRVTNAEGVNTTQSGNITTLTTNLSTLTDTVATKASATALTDLSTRVTATEGVNTSQATSLTNLTSSLATTNNNVTTAQNTANSATSAASSAQGAANTALTNAATANNLLTDIASDAKLTSSEKQAVRNEWNVIAAEKPVNNTQATTFAVTTENTAYNTAFQALANYLNNGATWSTGVPNWITDANLSATTTIVGATFRTNFANYYAARTALLNRIAARAKELADAAQATADAANSLAGTKADASALTTTNTNVSNLNGVVTAQGTRVSTLEGKVDHPSTGLATKASVTYVDTATAAVGTAAASSVQTLRSEVVSNQGEKLYKNFDGGIALWTNSRTGLPTAVATATGSLVTDDADFGACGQFALGFSASVGPKDWMPVRPGRVYRLRCRFKVQTMPPEGIVRFNSVIGCHTASGAVASDGTAINSASTGDLSAVGVYQVEGLYAHTASSGVAPFDVGTVLARPLLRVDSTLAGLVVRVQSMLFEDITEVRELSAAVQVESTTRAAQTGELYAQYTVKTDVGGLISGYGLASTANNAAPTSAFGIQAGQFFVAPPTVNQATAPVDNLYKGFVWRNSSTGLVQYWTGSTWSTTPQSLPFVVQTAPTTINGVAVPAGVYMADAFIQNGTITNAKIGNAAIDSLKVADAAISTAKIANAAITTAKIGDAQITSALIANAAITNALIANAAITTAKIGSAQITSALIADANITNAKIADAAITNAKIGSAAVNTANIGDAQITSAKIANLAVTGAKIANATITSAQIANATITSAKIGTAEVDTLNLAGNAVSVSSAVSGTATSISVSITIPPNVTARVSAAGYRATINANGSGSFPQTLALTGATTATENARTVVASEGEFIGYFIPSVSMLNATNITTGSSATTVTATLAFGFTGAKVLTLQAAWR
jgi:hypothetical protein